MLFSPSNFFKSTVNLTVKPLVCIRGRRELSLRSLRGEGALRRLRGVKEP